MRKIKFGMLMLGLLASVLFTGCFHLEELQIGGIKNIQFKGMNNNLITLQLTIPIENPNPYRIKVKSSDVKVIANGKEIGRIKQMDKLVISGKSNKDYNVRVTIEITNITGGLASAFKMVQGDTDFRLSGKMKVQSFLYFKTIDIENYKLTH